MMHLLVYSPPDHPLHDLAAGIADMPVRKTVNVPISSDKGMCGGINTGVAKLANACMTIDGEGEDCLPHA
jgi:F0F1-type ATP synthase gamma subunit